MEITQERERIGVGDAAMPAANRSRFILAVGILLTSLALIVSITGNTLWIDEGFSAWMASHRTFGGLVTTFRTGDSGDLQTPLYYCYLWLWVKLCGHGEYALRAANIPFVILLCTAFAITSLKVWGRLVGWTVICLSPFVWAYVDEARGYLPVMACAAVAIGAILTDTFAARPDPGTPDPGTPDPGTKGGRWSPAICLGALLAAAGIHMLSLFVLPGIAAIAAWGIAEDRSRWWQRWRRPLLVALPFFLLLASYYTWTIIHGTGYTYPPFGFAYVGLMGYEFLGFGGLGPGRNVLRLPPVEPSLLRYWPWLSAGAIGLAVALSAALMIPRTKRDRRPLIALLIAIALSFAGMLACGVVLRSRLLPRHAAALHPLVLLTMLALAGARKTAHARTGTGYLAIAALALVWIVSDWRLRFVPDYRKEDYRGTVTLVRSIARGTGADVAWSADALTGAYYGLDLFDPVGPPERWSFKIQDQMPKVSWPVDLKASQAKDWSPSFVQQYLLSHRREGRPVVLALTKPDLYDRQNAWRPFLASNQAKPVAQRDGFQIYVLR